MSTPPVSVIFLSILVAFHLHGYCADGKDVQISEIGDEILAFKLGARVLPPIDHIGTAPDPFVKVMGPEGYAQSETIDNAFNPNWNQTFTAYYRPNGPSDAKLNFEVMSKKPGLPESSIGNASVLISEIRDPFLELDLSLDGQGGYLIFRRVDMESGGGGGGEWSNASTFETLPFLVICGILLAYIPGRLAYFDAQDLSFFLFK